MTNMTECRILFDARLDEIECSWEDCDEQPVGVRLDVDPDLVLTVGWVCADHEREARELGVKFKPIRRTCGSGTTGPCGAAASHLLVIATPDDRCRTTAACERHMDETEEST